MFNSESNSFAQIGFQYLKREINIGSSVSFAEVNKANRILQHARRQDSEQDNQVAHTIAKKGGKTDTGRKPGKICNRLYGSWWRLETF